MSFHKRIIKEDTIISIYSNDGINGVKRYFSADALTISDAFSDKIYRYMIDHNYEGVKNLIVNNVKYKELSNNI